MKNKRRKNKERRKKNCDRKKKNGRSTKRSRKRRRRSRIRRKHPPTTFISSLCLSARPPPPRTGASRCVWIAERLTLESRKINIGSCAAPSQCLSHPIKIEKTISSRQHITWEQLISSRYPLRENGP